MIDWFRRKTMRAAVAAEPPPFRSERRSTARAKLVFQVGWIDGDEARHEIRIRNISPTGMMFTSAVPRKPGELLTIILRDQSRLPATVRWVDGQATGVEFERAINHPLFEPRALQDAPED